METILGMEADSVFSPQSAQSGCRCGRHCNAYSDLSGTGAIHGQGLSSGIKAGHYFQRISS
ncbi:hypothetical protein DPMN_096885 [Dreissena polymorpha]|uniref:Uncharacterized protein n=1 Tax=Dreissena polymorpha TaxID=45954 RepID=A0A9D4L988_DREPO|nr:hypothetical protein DPMN_096885 [Dreissena polymorpha]